MPILAGSNSDYLAVSLNSHLLEQVVVIEVFGCLTVSRETGVPSASWGEPSDGGVIPTGTMLHVTDNDDVAVRVDRPTFTPVVFTVFEVRSHNSVIGKRVVFAS